MKLEFNFKTCVINYVSNFCYQLETSNYFLGFRKLHFHFDFYEIYSFQISMILFRHQPTQQLIIIKLMNLSDQTFSTH